MWIFRLKRVCLIDFCKMRVRICIATILFAVMSVITVEAAPRFAVNIIVSGLRQGDIARYEKNLGKGGFLRLRSEGVEYAECYADYAPTSSEAGLATLATGTFPSVHGIFSSVVFDRTTGKENGLCRKTQLLPEGTLRKEVEYEYMTEPFVAQTLSEAVLASSERNRVITIAHNAVSAMILAGSSGECYWIDKNGKWNTAECYTDKLPSWVRACNADEINRVFATNTWYGRYTRDRYRNKNFSNITIYEESVPKRPRSNRKLAEGWVDNLRSMPSGNFAIFEFAKRAVSSLLPLHVEDECKVLNICLDVPRTIAERYGTDSIEYEDMLYSLDAVLSEFLIFLYAQIPSRDELLVTLSSDSGISPTKMDNSDTSRFNPRQFEVLMNAFLSARYGQDSWILGYTNGSLYLNHDVIYRHKVSVAEVQNEVASFALQYRGVATAVTATAMRSAQFSRGAMSLVQNGYNPRRSGDVMIVLDAERIEYDVKRVAMSGSIYNYDRHVPFIVCGAGITPREEMQRISNEQIAPSLALLLGVERPQSSEAEIVVIDMIKKQDYDKR